MMNIAFLKRFWLWLTQTSFEFEISVRMIFKNNLTFLMSMNANKIVYTKNMSLKQNSINDFFQHPEGKAYTRISYLSK